MTSASGSTVDDPGVAVPAIVGFHHVRLPVTDVMRSRDWYVAVFGFEPSSAWKKKTMWAVSSSGTAAG